MFQRLLRKAAVAVLVLLSAAAAWTAAEEKDSPGSGAEEVVSDCWRVTRMEGHEVGWQHDRIVKVTAGGKDRYVTEMTMKNELLYRDDILTMARETRFLEDAQGRILQFSTKSVIQDKEFSAGLDVVNGEGRLTVTGMGKTNTSTIPWTGTILGPMGILRLRLEKGFEPGTGYSFRTFDPERTNVLEVTVSVKGDEETELLDGKTEKLHYTVSSYDLIRGLEVHEWWNDEAELQKFVVRFPGLTEYVAASEMRAKNRIGGSRAELLMQVMVHSKVNLPAPARLEAVLFELKVREEGKGSLPNLSSDARQEVAPAKDGVVRVLSRTPAPTGFHDRPAGNLPAELKEYVEPNSMIQSDHPDIKAKAEEVVAGEDNAWKAAGLLTRFVYDYITEKDVGIDFAGAAETLETRRAGRIGHGVLLAALCRAAGIPARVAAGYAYLGGAFGGLAWTEVWIDGAWYAIDGAWGTAPADPTHVAFFRSSLKDIDFAAEFGTMVAAIAKLDTKIVEFTLPDGRIVKAGEPFKDYVIEGDVYTNIFYGVKLRKPEEYKFADYERKAGDWSPLLVKLEGAAAILLQAEPVDFAFTPGDFAKKVSAAGFENVRVEEVNIAGRNAVLIAYGSSGRPGRLLSLVDRGTCLTLHMDGQNEERDVAAFRAVAGTLELTD